MSIYRKNAAGEVKKIASYMIQRWNDRLFNTTHSYSADGLTEYYDITSDASVYITNLSDYTEFALMIHEPNTTINVFIRFNGLSLKIKETAIKDITVGALDTYIKIYTLNASVDGNIYFKPSNIRYKAGTIARTATVTVGLAEMGYTEDDVDIVIPMPPYVFRDQFKRAVDKLPFDKDGVTRIGEIHFLEGTYVGAGSNDMSLYGVTATISGVGPSTKFKGDIGGSVMIATQNDIVLKDFLHENTGSSRGLLMWISGKSGSTARATLINVRQEVGGGSNLGDVQHWSNAVIDLIGSRQWSIFGYDIDKYVRDNLIIRDDGQVPLLSSTSYITTILTQSSPVGTTIQLQYRKLPPPDANVIVTYSLMINGVVTKYRDQVKGVPPYARPFEFYIDTMILINGVNTTIYQSFVWGLDGFLHTSAKMVAPVSENVEIEIIDISSKV